MSRLYASSLEGANDQTDDKAYKGNAYTRIQIMIAQLINPIHSYHICKTKGKVICKGVKQTVNRHTKKSAKDGVALRTGDHSCNNGSQRNNQPEEDYRIADGIPVIEKCPK